MFSLTDQERGLLLDFCLTSLGKTLSDMVFYVIDQYTTALPSCAVPIGGPPRYRYDMKLHGRRGFDIKKGGRPALG